MAIFKLGAFTHWKQVSKDFLGRFFPAEVAQVQSQNQNANISDTTIETPKQSSLRRVLAMTIVTTADASSSTLPKVTIKWTDADNSTAQSSDITSTQTGNTKTTSSQGSLLINPKAGTNVTYGTYSYASNTGGAMKYSVNVVLEAL